MTSVPVSSSETIELAPNYNIPIVIILLAVPLGLWKLWLGIPLAVFGLFLLAQTMTIRLKFTASTLEVYRSGNLIRSFPYADWINWCIFWPQLPILFYFREVKSIHFLPIIFDYKTLQTCLQTRCSNK